MCPFGGVRDGEEVPPGLKIWNDKKGAGWIAEFKEPKGKSQSRWFNVRSWGSWRFAFLLAKLQRAVWEGQGAESAEARPSAAGAARPVPAVGEAVDQARKRRKVPAVGGAVPASAARAGSPPPVSAAAVEFAATGSAATASVQAVTTRSAPAVVTAPPPSAAVAIEIESPTTPTAIPSPAATAPPASAAAVESTATWSGPTVATAPAATALESGPAGSVPSLVLEPAEPTANGAKLSISKLGKGAAKGLGKGTDPDFPPVERDPPPVAPALRVKPARPSALKRPRNDAELDDENRSRSSARLENRSNLVKPPVEDKLPQAQALKREP